MSGVAGLFVPGTLSKARKKIDTEINNKDLCIQTKLSYTPIEGDDVMDAQIKTNCDLTINKILYYLSQLPIQLSLKMMIPKLYQMCEYKRFNDYISSWPTSTDQMKTIRIMYTDMEPGFNEIALNCSYLKKKFFIEYPMSKPDE